jgi:hypothetical protein
VNVRNKIIMHKIDCNSTSLNWTTTTTARMLLEGGLYLCDLSLLFDFCVEALKGGVETLLFPPPAI